MLIGIPPSDMRISSKASKALMDTRVSTSLINTERVFMRDSS